MKRFRLLARVLSAVAVAAFALALTGCSSAPVVGGTPIFSAQERFARINRNIALESRMLNDDLDRLFLLRPVSSLTEWNVP